jgi:hypothetical protein
MFLAWETCKTDHITCRVWKIERDNKKINEKIIGLEIYLTQKKFMKNRRAWSLEAVRHITVKCSRYIA